LIHGDLREFSNDDLFALSGAYADLKEVT